MTPMSEDTSLLRTVRANAAAVVQMRKAATQDLERSREIAKRTEASKLKFLAGVSHELRTPLNSIIGFVDLVLSGEVGPVENPKHAEYLRLAKGSAEHLNEIILAMLDAARIEMGKTSLHFETIDVVPLCRDCVAFLDQAAARYGTAIEFDGTDAEGLHFRQDATRLRQIVLNLLRNAIEYSPEGVPVTLRAMAVAPALVNGGVRHVRFEVSDQGPGISEANQKLLFMPFHQVESPFVRSRDGLGLGLSISQSLSIAMGGTIGCTSREGDGATFWVELPDRTDDE